MFWKKKNLCEHEWVYIDKAPFSDYEVYCPKCNHSRFYTLEADALACIKKSVLRNEYLKEINERE